MRILIIEDDHVGAHVFSNYLRKGGFKVQVAHDGPNGISQFRESRPDAVLLDIMLPGMSGIDVLKVLRGESPTLPIIVYTNGYVAHLVQEASSAGATSVINKLNLNANELVQQFRRLSPKQDAATPRKAA